MRASVIALALGLSCAVRSPAGPSADAPRTGPIGGGGTVELEPASPPRPAATTRRLVFACVGDGVPVTFSDRPCGPAAATRELRVVPAGTAPGAAPQVVPPRAAAEPRRPAPATPPAASARQRDDGTSPAAGRDRDATASRCQRLREAVASLDEHMRTGYSARESARLWTRWREAKERLRKSGC